MGYYCEAAPLAALAADAATPTDERLLAQELLDYWRPRTTLRTLLGRVEAMPALPPGIARGLAVTNPSPPEPFVAASAWRIAGVNPDYDRLLRLGIPGLRAEIHQHRPTLEALLRAYFAHGGPQAMITVVGRGELEAALREPEKYQNLVVRVGGFSARFVTLYRELQEDIIARTLN